MALLPTFATFLREFILLLPHKYMIKYQHTTHQSLGAFSEYALTDQGLSGRTAEANVRVLNYGPKAVRISVSQQEVFDDFSFAVVSEPQNLTQSWEDTADLLRLSWDGFVLEIQKNPVRFRFLTPDGKVINEDDPAFGTAWLGPQMSAYKVLQEGERFIGLGEKTGNLDRRGEGYTNWTTDYFAYPNEADMIYGAHPFYMGLHNGLAYGIFLDNTYKTHFNFGASNDRFSSFTAEEGDLNYYFFAGTPAEILKAYTDLTGRAPMPPKWSLGYQQCRYSYYPDHELLTVAKTFRDKQIPADVVYCDIHYMDKYKIFSWDQERFPDPKGMMDTLTDQGFHLVVIADPGIKKQEGYAPYEDGVKEDVFIKYPDGQPYSGEVWPGWCHFPDFSDERARRWWGDWFREYTKDGLEGFWNDMNEPAT
ncbi:MAG TPA: glycoside hydrolase family 31, partial [Cytophagales bacterium]|nr:glycoside hydrolase family 31 [Cytophagales bacterium]